MKVLVTADPIERFQPKFDTTLRLTAEYLKRGISVDYMDLTHADATQKASTYLGRLPVHAVEHVDPKATPFIRLSPVRIADVGEYDVILHRKDPPVDDFYRDHTQKFSHAPKRILQINNPDLTWRLSEHILTTEFPEHSIPTIVCETAREFIAAVRAQSGEAVAKPENECSGVGIAFFPNDTPQAELDAYWAKWKPLVVVQPYVDEITKSGDLRILVMNGKIMGSVLRVARQGSRLANLHQGATWRAFTPTPKQVEACDAVGRALAEHGLYLLGLDFIGDRLSEINFTSPSAMVQINEVMGQRTEVLLVNEIEALRVLRQRSSR